MDTQKLLMFGAIGIGLYLLLAHRSRIVAAVASTGTPAPAAAVTSTYTSTTLTGAPTPIIDSLGDAAFGRSFMGQYVGGNNEGTGGA